MIISRKLKTYPYIIDCWPPRALAKRAEMISWLDKNVSWDGNLVTKNGLNPEGAPVECHPRLYYYFRVETPEDVALLKMRM